MLSSISQAQQKLVGVIDLYVVSGPKPEYNFLLGPMPTDIIYNLAHIVW